MIKGIDKVIIFTFNSLIENLICARRSLQKNRKTEFYKDISFARKIIKELSESSNNNVAGKKLKDSFNVCYSLIENAEENFKNKNKEKIEDKITYVLDTVRNIFYNNILSK